MAVPGRGAYTPDTPDFVSGLEPAIRILRVDSTGLAVPFRLPLRYLGYRHSVKYLSVVSVMPLPPGGCHP